MKVFYQISQITDIIQQKAKYQKVFLLYDTSVGNSQIADVYNYIKDFCIFNAKRIDEDMSEVYNGYKAIIYYCSGDSFIKHKPQLEEFVNIFIPTDQCLLPFYLNNDYKASKKEDYLISNQQYIDAGLYNSIYFNNFYNHIYQLIYLQNSNVNFDFDNRDITHLKLIQTLSNLDNEIVFFDIKLIENCNIPYEMLPVVDYVLTCAFLCFIKAVKQGKLSMIDVYKLANNNQVLINKFYAMVNNQLVLTIINLNQHYLYLTCQKTREKILTFINDVDKQQIEFVISKIKQFAAQDDGLLGYLYFYNVFGL